MSNRQVKKLLSDSQKVREVESESEEEEEPVGKKNFFGGVDVDEISSDSEGSAKPEVSTRNVARSEEKKEKDFYEILDELHESHKHTPVEIEAPSKTESVFRRHKKNFDPSTETQKLFKEERKGKRTVHKSGKRLALTPDVNWPSKIEYLLAMEKVSDPSKNIFYFDISKGYSKIHPNYVEAVETNDANAISQFLHRYPFHIEALYQMCMVFQMQGNYEQVAAHVERLLYSFQLSFHYQFSVISNEAEIDIQMNVYNKIFFKALMMHADCLGRKGCVRTALEVVKLIFSLNSQRDPLGCIFLIDYYSIRAKKIDYFMEFVRNFTTEVYGFGCSLEFPNLLYSLALVKAIQSDYFDCTDADISSAESVERLETLFTSNSAVVLICALSWHPQLAKALLKKLGSTEIKDEEIDKIGEVFAARNEDLWKPHIGWLKRLMNIKANVKEKEIFFEGVLDRYKSLDKCEFSFDVRTVIPAEMEVGRPVNRGNLNISAHPVYLFFATMLPWNYIG